MIARINFSSYPNLTQKNAIFTFVLRLADDCNWKVPMTSFRPVYVDTHPYLLADTVTKQITLDDGTGAFDNEYDALTQLTTILNAIRNNSRVVTEIGGINWGFDTNGDVYANKIFISSADFASVIAARTTAMGG